MEKLNWIRFELKFEGKQEDAFQELAKSLFCSELLIKGGLSGYKNHPGLETDPVKVGRKYIGFQAKYASPSVSLPSKKQAIINSIITAKKNETNLDTIYIYVNKQPSPSSKKGVNKPKFLEDIEKVAFDRNIELVWKFSDQIANELSLSKNLNLAKTYFPDFIEKSAINSDSQTHNKEELLNISRTALIQIEIAKLKFEFTDDWNKNKHVINQLQTYVDFRNEILARDIFSFLNTHVSAATRAKMPSTVACAIHSLVLTYFPSSYGKDELNLRMENGSQCVYTGFNIVYDSFIYTNNFRVALWGLNILKFIYRESKRSDYNVLVDLVLEQYKELESTLNRPERNDLENAKELLQLFKDDLDTYSLAFPRLPDHIYELTLIPDNHE
jgi:hypothetical protein